MNKFTSRDWDMMIAGACGVILLQEIIALHWWNVAGWLLLSALHLWRLRDGWNLHYASLKAWRWLQGWLPVTVWKVDGPIGCGPWCMSPREAAGFIAYETTSSDPCIPVEELETVLIPEDLITHLENGQTSAIEWKEWTIKRITIRRNQLEEEWSGW